MSGDPEQDYFCDGLVDDIITALSHVPRLFVVARNSTFTYKDRAADVRRVGQELGVRYVLEGSVRRSGDRLRLTGQLIGAGDGTHLWAERFDGRVEDIFDLQDDMTARVVEQSHLAWRRRKLRGLNGTAQKAWMHTIFTFAPWQPCAG